MIDDDEGHGEAEGRRFDETFERLDREYAELEKAAETAEDEVEEDNTRHGALRRR